MTEKVNVNRCHRQGSLSYIEHFSYKAVIRPTFRHRGSQPCKSRKLNPRLNQGLHFCHVTYFCVSVLGNQWRSKKMVLKSVYHIVDQFFGKVISIVLNILSLNGPNIRGKFVSSITACSGGHIQNDVFIR